MISRDDVLRMARETAKEFGIAYKPREEDALVRFAALVAAAEREACAKIVDNVNNQDYVHPMTALDCAAAIRARGQESTSSYAWGPK